MIEWVSWSRISSQRFCPLLRSTVCPQSSSRVSRQHRFETCTHLTSNSCSILCTLTHGTEFARRSSYGFCRVWRKRLSKSLLIMITHTWLITSRKIMDATGFQESPRLQFLTVLSPGGILVMSLCLRNRFSFQKRTNTA
jgi:hypothetical protein